MITHCILATLALASSASVIPVDDRFDRWDRNRDGRLVPKEIPEGLRGNFDRVDRDGDGFIGPVEVLRKPGSLISSFGEANDGTTYAVTFEQSEQGPGAIWKIVAR